LLQNLLIADMIVIMSDEFSRLLDQLPHVRRHLRDGALLFEREDMVARFYRVRKGEVRMLRRQRDGEAFILQRAGPGASVAEASLFSARYHCSAVAVGETEVDVWKHQQVRALIENTAPAALAYAQHMAGAVRQARIRSEITSLRRVADRLNAWLAWHDGQMPERGSWLQVAREIAVAPEALYRELARRRRVIPPFLVGSACRTRRLVSVS
jgi:CRP/FNR family transcriptional regulator, dissimilatory nitrate respiration regulator